MAAYSSRDEMTDAEMEEHFRKVFGRRADREPYTELEVKANRAERAAMQSDRDTGCTCYDETTRKCPVPGHPEGVAVMSDCQNDLQDEIDEAAMRRDNVAAAPGQPNDPVPVPVSFRDTKEIPGLRRYNLTDEAWREYDFGGRVYRIVEPIALYYRENGDTHRVVDSQGTTHCCPAPGNGDCVLRWGGGRFVSF